MQLFRLVRASKYPRRMRKTVKNPDIDRKALFNKNNKDKRGSGAKAITGGAKPGWAGPARQQRAASQDSFVDLQNRVQRFSVDVLLSPRSGRGLFASSCARPLSIANARLRIPACSSRLSQDRHQHEPGDTQGLNERNKIPSLHPACRAHHRKLCVDIRHSTSSPASYLSRVPDHPAFMAWQSPSAMAGNGGGLGGAPSEGVPGHPHPQGTEYTLQGEC
jgi:hypothetical protein